MDAAGQCKIYYIYVAIHTYAIHTYMLPLQDSVR
jgi:hypothetical protein